MSGAKTTAGSRAAQADLKHGIINVSKPPGMTSHDVVAAVRRMTGQRKVGHAGTLDPMAIGVLLLCLGQATRLAEYLVKGQKRYRAVVCFGIETDTYDAEGAVVTELPSFTLSFPQIEQALGAFLGTIQQIPPPYSAVRRQGRRLYELARQGIAVEAEPRQVEIESLEVTGWNFPQLTLEVACSPGTYIRSLAHDLGQALGVGAHLSALTRTASGPWRIEDAISLDDLAVAAEAGDWARYLNPPDAALQEFQRVDLSAEMAGKVAQGQIVPLPDVPRSDLIRVYTPRGRFLALLQPGDAPDYWRPKKVFHF